MPVSGLKTFSSGLCISHSSPSFGDLATSLRVLYWPRDSEVLLPKQKLQGSCCLLHLGKLTFLRFSHSPIQTLCCILSPFCTVFRKDIPSLSPGHWSGESNCQNKLYFVLPSDLLIKINFDYVIFGTRGVSEYFPPQNNQIEGPYSIIRDVFTGMETLKNSWWLFWDMLLRYFYKCIRSWFSAKQDSDKTPYAFRLEAEQYVSMEPSLDFCFKVKNYNLEYDFQKEVWLTLKSLLF